jgi:NADPH:quinone reductase
MKAIRVQEFGGPEVMCEVDLPDLTPDSGQILVDVLAAGVNPVDSYIRSGQYPIQMNLPYTPGFDGAGIIHQVGDDIKHFHAGDKVYLAGSITGTYAQQALCSVNQIFHLPEEINFDQGAAIGIPYATAYRALFTKAKAVDQETVLIHGASGGVGIASLQLAKISKLQIIATAGSERGLELLHQQGAHVVMNHLDVGHFKEVWDATRSQGVDIILEMLANVNLGEDLKILSPHGRVVVIGCRGVVEINPREAMMRDATIVGLSLMNSSVNDKIKIYHALEEGFHARQLIPVIGKIFPLAEASFAHKAIMESGAFGKVVLHP